jgi:hypothetical protein
VEKPIKEIDMAAGGGPSLDQWKRMSKTERRKYWIFIGVLMALATSAVAYALLSQ